MRFYQANMSQKVILHDNINLFKEIKSLKSQYGKVVWKKVDCTVVFYVISLCLQGKNQRNQIKYKALQGGFYYLPL